MLNRMLSFTFVALGLAGFGAAVYMQPRGAGFYAVGSELILYGLLIAAGIGFFRGWPAGRILALALLRVGSFAILVVPIGIVVWITMWQQGGDSVFKVLGGLFFAFFLLAASANKTDASPLFYVVGAFAALAAISYVCARLYRRLASPEAGAMFASETPPADGRPFFSERGRINLLVFAILALALGAKNRIMISEYELPAFLQSEKVQQWHENAAQERLSELVGEPFFIEGGKGLVLILNDNLVYVDVATGKAVRKEFPREVVAHPIESRQRPTARFSREGSLFWSNGTSELVDLQTGKRLQAQLEAGFQQYVAIGFVDGSQRFLLFDRVNSRILCLDTGTAQPVYAVDVLPPGGFSSDYYRKEFLDRMARLSALSPDQTKLAWSYLDTLYVVDTGTGAIETLPLPGQRDFGLYFSREGGHILTMKAYEKKPGSLIDLGTKLSTNHDIHGIDMLHFSVAEGLIALMPRAEGSPFENTVMGWHLGDLATPLWKAGFNQRGQLRVSGDGKRLYAYNAEALQIESAELPGLRGEAEPAFVALPVPLSPGRMKRTFYFPESRLLVVVESPKIVVVRLDASGAVAGVTTVDLTGF